MEFGLFRIILCYLQAKSPTMDNKIITYSTLYDLVENDTKDHKIKEITILFLNAMNDWPTFNQKEIPDFMKELKGYFGAPLTIEKIEKKEFNGQNAWQLEAGSSIKELITVSKKNCNQSDFDKIVDNILHYYCSLTKQLDDGQEKIMK